LHEKSIALKVEGVKGMGSRFIFISTPLFDKPMLFPYTVFFKIQVLLFDHP